MIMARAETQTDTRKAHSAGATGFIMRLSLFLLGFILLIASLARAELIDNGNDTVTDSATGLTWQKLESSSPMTWEQALSYVNNLELGGCSDWRLPDLKELASLVDKKKSDPAIDTGAFAQTRSAFYWSSSKQKNSAMVRGIDFKKGQSARQSSFSTQYFRAVSAGCSLDRTPPELLSTNPAAATLGVNVQTLVTATFSENIDPATLTGNNFNLGSGVSGALSLAGAVATFTPAAPLAYGTSYTATLTSAVKDLAGNALVGDYVWNFTTEGPPDAVPPSGSIAINGGAAWTHLLAATLDLSASDNSGSVADMRFSSDGVSWGNWESFASTRSWTLAAGDGNQLVYVQYRDAGGNVSSSYSDGILLDTLAPALSLNPVLSPTDQNSQLISGSVEAGSSVSVVVTLPALAGSVVTNAGAWSCTITGLVEGSNALSLSAVDPAGNQTLLTSAIVVDTSDHTPPTGTLSINAGAAATNQTAVILDLSAGDNSGSVTSMRFGSDGLVWGEWEAFALQKDWILSAGDGVKSVFVQYRDAAGNLSLAISAQISLDSAAPTLTAEPVSSPTNQTAQTLRGTAEAGATVTVTADTTAVIGAVTGSGGSWSCNLSELVAGTNRFTLVATDRAGNQEQLTVVILLDSELPSGALTINGGAALTDSATVRLSLSASDNGAVTAVRFANGGAAWSAWEALSAEKIWQLADGDGPKTVSAQYQDQVGNHSPIYSAGILLDTVPPELQVATENAIIASNNVRVTGSMELGATLSVSADSSAVVGAIEYPTSTSWEVAVTSLPEGVTSLTFSLTDSAGNLIHVVRAFTLDSQSPTGSLGINYGASYTSSQAVTLNLSASDETSAVESVRLRNAGESWSAWLPYIATRAWTLPDFEGSHSVEVEYQDGAGNVSTVYAAAIMLDRTDPLVRIDPLSQTLTNNPSLLLSGVRESDANIAVALPGGTIGTLEYPTTTRWQVSLTLAEGTNTITLTATDHAGNNASAATSLVLDSTAGLTVNPLSSPTQWADQILSGTREALAQISVVVSSPVTAQLSTPTATSWEVVVSGLVAGANPISVTATDSLGNVATSNLSITYDLTPPSGSLLINNGADSSSQQSVLLQLSASDNVGPPARMRFQNETGGWSDWFNYSSVRSWTLSGGDGTKTVSAQLEDAAGNQSTAFSSSIILDTSAPLVTINAAVSPTQQATQLFSGTMEAGSTVAVTAPGGLVGTVSYPDSQSWQVTAKLLEGSNAISAVATDGSGNRGSALVAVVLDTQAQVAVNPVLTPTSQTSQSLSGTREANAQIVVLAASSVVIAEVNYPSATTWSCALSNLAPGSNPLTINATDSYGNPGSASATIVVDTAAPTGTLSINNGAAWTNVIFVTLKLTAGDNLGPIVSMRFSNDGNSWSGWSTYASTRQWYLPYGDGGKTVYLQLKDAAGNISASISDSIGLDTLGPVLTLQPVISPTNLSHQTLSGTTEAAATVRVDSTQAIEGAVSRDGTDWSCPLTLTPGTNSITLTATDAAGNKTSRVTSIVLDQATSVGINAVTSPSNQTSQTLSGTREVGAGVTLSVDTTASVGYVSYPTATSWQASVSGLVAGANLITATASDSFGNSGSAARTITIDLIPPQVMINPFTALSNQAVRTLSGVRELSDTLAISGPGVTALGVSYSGTTWQGSIRLSEGVNSVTVKATDSAGNSSSKLLQLTLDSIAEVSIDSFSAQTNVASQTIGGTLEAGASLQLSVNTGAILGQVHSDGNRWSCPITLLSGPNLVTATVTDSLGNQNAVSRTLSLDTQAPQLSVNAIVSPTRNRILVLSGGVESGATVVVSAPGAVVFPVSVSNGSWQCTIDLPDGTTSISVTATDASSNQSRVETSIVVDTQVLLSLDALSLATNKATQTLSGSIEPGYSAFDFSVDTAASFGELQVAGSGWQRQLTLVDGLNTLRIAATDALGNQKVLTRTITLDTQPPSLSIDPLPTLTTEKLLTLSGSRSLDAQISLSLPGATVSTSGSSWQALVTLVEGSNQITATASDAAGNKASVSVSINLDSTAQMTFDAGAWSKSPTHVASQSVGGILEIGATLEIEMTGGGSYGPIVIDVNRWSCPITLAEGNNAIRLTATDSQGNSSSISRTVLLDTQAPAAVTLSATNTYLGGEIVLDWSGYDSSAEGVTRLLVYASETPLSDLNGRFPIRELDPTQRRITLTGLADNRSWYFAVVASDAAENLSAIQQVSAVPTLQGFQGFVRDARTGEPLFGASIEAGGYPAVTTNANGYYRLAGLPVGSYDLTISGGGYQSAGFTAVAVQSGAITQLNLSLTAIIVAPSVPQNLVAEAGDSQVTVRWDGVSDADLVGYVLYRMLEPTEPNPLPLSAQPISGTFFVDMDLDNGSRYYYLVKSINQAGTLSAASPLVSAIPQVAPPLPAAELAAVLNPNNSVTLLWSKSPTEKVSAYAIYSDNGSGVIDYGNPLATVNAPGVFWTSAPLVGDTTYYFALRTIKDGSEEKNQSLIVSVRVFASPITAPRAALDKPKAGQRLHGNRITLRAKLLQGDTSEVAHVRFQYRSVGEAGWQDMSAATVAQQNPDLTAPYEMRWDVLTLPSGYYELRALSTAKVGGAVDPAPETVMVVIDPKSPSHQEWVNEKVKHQLKESVARGKASRIELDLLDTAGSFIVDLPEAAVSSDTEILAEIPNRDELAGSLGGLNSIDQFLRLQLDSGQEEFGADRLVEIQIPYLDADNNGIVDGTSIAETDLKLLWLNRESGRWERTGIADVFVDIAANIISGRTSHFTDFGVMAPGPLAVTINAPTAPLNTATPTISGTLSAGATLSLSVSGNGTAGTVSYPTATSWQSPLSGLEEGQTSLTALVEDGLGGSATALATLTVDLTKPVGSLSINSGALSTPSSSVVLSLSAADQGSSVAQMKFKNEAGSWSAPVPFASSHSWNLSAGTGTKTVFAQFIDQAGNESAEVADSIEVQSQPSAAVPTGTAVTIQPTTDVRVTFASVTASGDFTVSDAVGLTPPAGFSPLANGSKELATTAGYSGSVTVCLDYRDADLRYPENEKILKLMHNSGAQWEDITRSVDTDANVVCGETNAFSPFMLVETPAVAPGITPTRVPVMEGWWQLLSLFAGFGIFARRRH